MTAPLRRNPLTGELVLVVPGRAGRPGATGRTVRTGDPATCPFCEGNEGLTPPEVAAYGRETDAADQPGWTVRVVPNKFPAFDGQEVVIHGPQHADAVADLAPGVLEAAVAAWRHRRDHHRAAGAAHLLVAINEGAAAGASLEHSHSQLVPFRETPPLAERELAAFAAGCPLCQRARGVIREADGLVSFCPPWGRMPYETWIAPADHRRRAPFDRPLAEALADMAQRFRRLLGRDVAWNAIVHDAPLGGDAPFHWHIELLPRLTVAAAIELGAGIWVNVVDPARAATELADAG
jgi:UDPglucose--hexose-1-phosphate uridylyltransferase